MAAQRFVVVVFDGVSLGIMSFAFGVFDMAQHYGVLLPDLEVRVVSGEPAAAVTGGGLSCYVPCYDWRAAEARLNAVPLAVAGFSGDFSGVRRFAERDHGDLVQWTMHRSPAATTRPTWSPTCWPTASAPSTPGAAELSCERGRPAGGGGGRAVHGRP